MVNEDMCRQYSRIDDFNAKVLCKATHGGKEHYQCTRKAGHQGRHHAHGWDVCFVHWL